MYYLRAYATTILGATTYGTTYSFTTPCATQFCRGQHYGGGTISYVDSTGNHGQIVCDSDLTTGIQWYNGTFVSTGAVNGAFGAGVANNIAILATQGPGSYASSLCDTLTLNGYTDWFLPSYNELHNAMSLYYVSVFDSYTVSGKYWSSSEVNANNAQAFEGGGTYGNRTVTKDTLLKVRAVRKF